MSNKINPHIYTFSLWGGVIAFAVFAVLSFYNPQFTDYSDLFELILFVCYMTATIYFLISLHRCWSILQSSTARTTPNKAVGFLFIPLFGFYWLFVAIAGLSKDANKYLNQKNANEKKISVGLSIATCILMIIPIVNFVVAPILQNILIYQWSKFFNRNILIVDNEELRKNYSEKKSLFKFTLVSFIVLSAIAFFIHDPVRRLLFPFDFLEIYYFKIFPVLLTIAEVFLVAFLLQFFNLGSRYLFPWFLSICWLMINFGMCYVILLKLDNIYITYFIGALIKCITIKAISDDTQFHLDDYKGLNWVQASIVAIISSVFALLTVNGYIILMYT